MKEYLDRLYEAVTHPVAPLVTFGVGLLLGLLLCSPANAGGYHKHYYTTEVTNVTTDTKGVALSLATAQHHFDFGTHSWQGSIGVGNFNSDSAISFGVAKRLNRVLVNASVAHEHDDTGVGVGVNWRF